MGDSRYQQLRISEGCQRDEVDTVREASTGRAGCLDRDARLAGATGADECEQANAGTVKQLCVPFSS